MRPLHFSWVLRGRRYRERHRALAWLRDEQLLYADPKWDDNLDARAEHDVHMTEEGVALGTFWESQVTQYIQRAATLGLDNPLGRQALMKGWAAYLGMIESMIRVYGPPPMAGAPSGTLLETPTAPG